MKIALLYVCVTRGSKTLDYASRFVGSYLSYPPGVPHDTCIICNGGPLSTEQGLVFAPLKPMFWPRPNDGGWDISAYIQAARGVCKDYDLVLCLGESVYFHRSGWLKRILDTWQVKNSLIGFFGSNIIRTHLQTSAFACSPAMLRLYPKVVRNKRERYEFEHGQRSFWRLMQKKYPVVMATWDRDWAPEEWRDGENILWRGDQSNCLMWSNHTDRWAAADAQTRARWSRNADADFR